MTTKKAEGKPFDGYVRGRGGPRTIVGPRKITHDGNMVGHRADTRFGQMLGVPPPSLLRNDKVLVSDL